MEEFKKFRFNLLRTIDVSLIAISIIILPVWIATSTPDIPSKISLYALVVSIPMLVYDLLFMQMPSIWFDSKKIRFLTKANRYVGVLFACVGIVAAIWHASWIAGLLFLVCGLYCSEIYALVFGGTHEFLQKEAKKESH